jgi:hypothetical protein
MQPAGAEPTILINHLGYNTAGSKRALLAAPSSSVVGEARMIGPSGVRTLTVCEPEAVDGWSTVPYRRIDFSDAVEPGEYRLEVDVDGARIMTSTFSIGDHRLQAASIADVTAYYRSARSSGEIDRKDRHAKFYGDDSGREVDARGGWLDASGDYSKFLSHLTYTSMMSPQQIPLCAWALMTAGEELAAAHPGFETSQRVRLRDEGLFGADFLVRFQAPEGHFYTAIFDALTKDLQERVITAPLQDSVRTQRWQAAYRHGGGLAIAALAKASTLDDRGDFDSDAYWAAAVRGFEHLEQHNREYSFDGEESVIDDYCALLAAAELVNGAARNGTDARRFVEAAERRAGALVARYRPGADGVGFLVGDASGRPFFHAAESGLPVVALLRFAEVAPESPAADEARQLAVTMMRDTATRVDAVTNPFGYFRYLAQPLGGEPRTGFFYPHENETGYWWQGENANIASIAYAATKVAALHGANGDLDAELRDRLLRLADDQLAWVTGLNPFDASMLQGRGHGNAEYLGEYQNSPGGILNGVTAGFDDEADIAFLPELPEEGDNSWRWVEQWIPHSGWFVLAVAALR